MRYAVFLLALVAASGCRHVFPVPYTVEQLRADAPQFSGEALVHYLAQPHADPGVCDVRVDPVLPKQDETLVEPLVEALEHVDVEPTIWKECALMLMPGLAPENRERMLGRLGRGVLWLFDEDDSTGRLVAIHDVLIRRPREDSEALGGLLERLRNRPRHDLDADEARLLDSFIITLELGRGQLNGQPVTQAVIEALQEDRLLLRMSKRLPDPELRGAARRQVVRLRIARSAWDEVRARADEVERNVLAAGRWAQVTSGLTLTAPQPPLELPFEVLLQQDVDAQTGRLVVPGARLSNVLPSLRLRGVVTFDVGWSRPLNICAPPVELEVDPCIEARDLELGVPDVRLDEDGVLRFSDSLPMSRVIELARRDEGLVMPLRLAGQPVTTLKVPLQLDEPPSLRFVGPPGQQGPALKVTAELLPSSVLFDAVTPAGVHKQVVWPRSARGDFEVASVGGDGVPGTPGARGEPGAAGANGGAAMCPTMPGRSGEPGGQGGPGGDGTDGGDGGDGGPVSVEVQCDATTPDCNTALELVSVLVRSRGGEAGEGGAAGRGGIGGPGGTGGAGASCTVNGTLQFLNSGFNGARGTEGPPGKAGAPGEAGMEGTVEVKRKE